MKKYLLFLFATVSLFSVNAQTPDDALRNSWFIPNGSARNTATGGVMASLGGDISANHVNPAGLGLYKTREIVLSPGYGMNNNKFSFRDSSSGVNKSAFTYGTSGFILGQPSRRGGKWLSSAFGLSVSQMANYNNHIAYKGSNNFSSFSEQYLEELVRDKADTNAALSNYIYGSSLAFRTYLVDKETNSSGQLKGYQSLVPISTGVIQQLDKISTGGYHEIALGFAENMDDKLYVGASLNIPVIAFKQDTKYRETDATNNPNNEFNYFEYTEKFSSSGVGIGAKLGFIYKPQDYLRLGFAIHTPSIIAFKDQVRAALTTDTEKYAGKLSETSDNLNSGNAGVREYNLVTPFHAIASASYVFREVENTKRQRGFISADVEYINYSGSRFSYGGKDEQTESIKNYYTSINDATKSYLKGSFNVKLGGELKFDPFMIRAGAAYYGSPYKDSELKANRFSLSGGLGLRVYGVFIDLAYSHLFNKDVNFPYRLNDKANTFAQQTGSAGRLMLTLGFKI
ncbi:MAG: hemin receptor [Chitinophagaceae bacterium]|nr:hemin receptor [Chitinophagaceae bacterium]